MTTDEALAIAARVKPKHRQPFNKLQGSVTTVPDFCAGVEALSKSYGLMGSTLAKARAQISQIAADVEYIENFHAGHVPVRRLHS